MMGRCRRMILLMMVWSLGAVSLAAEKPANPLIGKWKHTSGKMTLHIEAGRIHFLLGDGVLSLHADYTLARDHTVYGLITRVEGDELLRSALMLGKFAEPFSFHVRAEDGVLVLGDVKPTESFLKRSLLEGVYKPEADLAAARPRPDEQKVRRSMRVPSCALHGDRLDNFALNDVDGHPWEYKKDHRGRLLLLHFWYHSCSPCLLSIPHLVALQKDYGKHGLEVVSIACESGTIEEQRSHVRSVCGRYAVNYTTLLSDRGPDRCPVVEQLQVKFFPCLILLDESGHILWRSTRDGMDDLGYSSLKKMIEDRLIKQE